MVCRLHIPLASLLVGASACSPVESAAEDQGRDLEAFAALPIDLVGTVVDPTGHPLAGAQVTGPGVDATTGEDGAFAVRGLPRRNLELRVEAPGHHVERVATHLARGRAVALADTWPIVLRPRGPDEVRLVFGGDVSFGRRFLDPEETTPVDQVPFSHPEASIDAADPGPGTREALAWVAPMLGDADFAAVNLESPVLSDPSTPHPDKDFVFFTLPGSLPPLLEAGVDYVSLGNNHVYDYLEAGLAETLAHLASAGMPHSGAGSDGPQAFASHVTSLGGREHAFVSMCSVAGDAYDIGYVAGDDQGGAADLRDDGAVTQAIASQVDTGRVTVALLHTGQEYAEGASDYARDRFQWVADAGAHLVVGHHPHVAQGLEWIGETLVLHSLGNFVFDQARLETMLGMAVAVDMAGTQAVAARVRPVYLEDFRPRPVGGDLAARERRRLAALSPGVSIDPRTGWVDGGAPRAEPVEVVVTWEVPSSGTLHVDLRDYVDGALSLVELDLPEGFTVGLGRDILVHGDFEDYDTDEDVLEAARWDTDLGSVAVCTAHPHRGAAALCQTRGGSNRDNSVAPFRNRIRLPGDAEDTPNRDLTLAGYARGENAGRGHIVARYYASAGSEQFGEEELEILPGGWHEWTPFWADLTVPDDDAARALRLFVHHQPPARGEGLLSVDDLVVVAWAPPGEPGAPWPAAPHPFDFLRVEGPPGEVQVRMSFRVGSTDAARSVPESSAL